MIERSSPPKSRPMQWQWWARRMRVPLGFVTAALFLVATALRAPNYATIAWSLILVVPGLLLRAAASGTVKKNRELTVGGPYAYTRNPLYLGSALIAAGFAVGLFSWVVALAIAIGFAAIYIPVILSEEQFLRSTFPGFDNYCASVPRFFPRFTPARPKASSGLEPGETPVTSDAPGGFSIKLYLQHREYNAALGAALLYLGLLFLRPALEFVLYRVR